MDQFRAGGGSNPVDHQGNPGTAPSGKGACLSACAAMIINYQSISKDGSIACSQANRDRMNAMYYDLYAGTTGGNAEFIRDETGYSGAQQEPGKDSSKYESWKASNGKDGIFDKIDDSIKNDAPALFVTGGHVVFVVGTEYEHTTVTTKVYRDEQLWSLSYDSAHRYYIFYIDPADTKRPYHLHKLEVASKTFSATGTRHPDNPDTDTWSSSSTGVVNYGGTKSTGATSGVITLY